jgi:hypothetical protein
VSCNNKNLPLKSLFANKLIISRCIKHSNGSLPQPDETKEKQLARTDIGGGCIRVTLMPNDKDCDE